MSESGVAESYTKADFTSDQTVRWCPGCGDYSILAQMQKVLPEPTPRAQPPFGKHGADFGEGLHGREKGLRD